MPGDAGFCKVECRVEGGTSAAPARDTVLCQRGHAQLQPGDVAWWQTIRHGHVLVGDVHTFIK